MNIITLYIINRIKQTKFVPSQTPAWCINTYPKSKDKKDSVNYMGIAVTSIIGKLLEKTWLLTTNHIIKKKKKTGVDYSMDSQRSVPELMQPSWLRSPW